MPKKPDTPVPDLATLPPDALLRIGDVERILNISRWVIYRQIKNGTMPKPMRLLDTNLYAWRAEDIRKLIRGES